MEITLAIAALFRDEAPYLKEWIEFHREMGVQRFYLFNNLSTDHFLEVLQPYINMNLVELTSWPIEHRHEIDWNGIQMLAYERALHFASGRVKWLALIDTDEFLYPVKDDNLIDFLSRYEECSGIGINWQIYGTSNVSKIPDDRLLIEMLTWKLEEGAEVNHHIKCIVRPERVDGGSNPHFLFYKSGCFTVNTDKIRIKGPFSPYVQINEARINHYTFRDRHFFETKKLARMKQLNPYLTEHEPWTGSMKQVKDESILRFAHRLKERIF